MAATAVTNSHALAQTAYRQGLILEVETRALLWNLVGTDPDSVFVVEDSPGEKRGTLSKVRFQAWNPKPMPKGRTGYQKGLASSPTWYEDEFRIGFLDISQGEVENEAADQQQVDFSLMESTQLKMAKEAADILERSLMHIVSGYSPVNDLATYSNGGTDYLMSLCNAAIEPHASHHFFAADASGSNASEAAVAADSTATAKSREIFSILRKLRSKDFVDWPVSPASTPWGRGYVVIGNGEFIEQIKENTSDSDIYDLARACIEGGMPAENSTLWTNEGFKIRNCFFLEHDFATFGTSGSSAGSTTAGEALSNVKRAVILGARAAHIRFGEGFTGGNHLGYSEDKEHQHLSMKIFSVLGAKKTIVNSSPWASAVYSHYSEATVSGDVYT